MSKHPGRLTAPKKARWSTAKKAARASQAAPSQGGRVAKPHRRQASTHAPRVPRVLDERAPVVAGRPTSSPRPNRPSARPAYGERPVASKRPAYGQRPMRSQRPTPRRTSSYAAGPTRTSRSQATPAPVAQDNAFAALGLPAVLVERLARDGVIHPFPIQAATIPDALAGRDVLGRGQTGSGKTYAFGLPTLARLAAGRRATPRRPRALVLSPTRELAIQISDALEPLAHVVGVRHKLVAGGMPYQPQLSALDRGVELLVATPGRLIDLVERGAVDLGDVDVAILDEADHMAEMGFLPGVTQILDLVPEGRQRLLFSATLDRGVDDLVARYLVDPVTHSTDAATASVTTMEHHVVLVDPSHKKVITGEVAGRDGRTLVFVRTKLGADRVASQLREQGVFAAALHGGLAQGARNRVLGAFRDGSLPVLVATDVAARGIHVDDVGVVLQVDPPADSKDYLHRSGRTARAGDRGTVVTLALPHQRKGMERLAREAGVEVTPARAAPGDAELTAATGARPPSGVPVPEHQVRRLLEGEQPRRRGPLRPGSSRSAEYRRSTPRTSGTRG